MKVNKEKFSVKNRKVQIMKEGYTCENEDKTFNLCLTKERYNFKKEKVEKSNMKQENRKMWRKK